MIKKESWNEKKLKRLKSFSPNSETFILMIKSKDGSSNNRSLTSDNNENDNIAAFKGRARL